MALVRQKQAPLPVVVTDASGNADDSAAGSLGTLPIGATQVTSSVALANGTSSQATIPAVAGKTSYISGIYYSSAGNTSQAGISGTITVTGIVGSSMVFRAGNPGLPGSPENMYISFVPPIVATAVNTAITVAAAAVTTFAGSANISLSGFNV